MICPATGLEYETRGNDPEIDHRVVDRIVLRSHEHDDMTGRERSSVLRNTENRVDHKRLPGDGRA